MPEIVWTDDTRDAVDALHITRTGDRIALAMVTSGADRGPLAPEATRTLTPTTARVLAGQLIAAAVLIEHDPRETLAEWSADTLDAIAETMTRARFGRPA